MVPLIYAASTPWSRGLLRMVPRCGQGGRTQGIQQKAEPLSYEYALLVDIKEQFDKVRTRGDMEPEFTYVTE